MELKLLPARLNYIDSERAPPRGRQRCQISSLLGFIQDGSSACAGALELIRGLGQTYISLFTTSVCCCSSSPAVIGANNPELSFQVVLKNKKENAYNPQVLATFSSNLYYSSVFPPVSMRNLPRLSTGRTLTGRQL